MYDMKKIKKGGSMKKKLLTILLLFVSFSIFAETPDSICVSWRFPEKNIRGLKYTIEAKGGDNADVVVSIKYRENPSISIELTRDMQFPVTLIQEINREETFFSKKVSLLRLVTENCGDYLMIISSIEEEETIQKKVFWVFIMIFFLGLIFGLARLLSPGRRR